MTQPFLPADILLPAHADLEKWAVIACDQFSSQPEYWQEVRRHVGKAPSCLHMILPEAELEQENAQTIPLIHQSMLCYWEAGLLQTYPRSFVYVERTLQNGLIRRGVIGMIDLEHYDYRAGSHSAIRATEQTVLERIPPRMRIRRGAALDLPHVILLCDDAEQRILPCAAHREKPLYAFDLMQGGGHIAAWLVDGAAADALQTQLNGYCAQKVQASDHPLLFAVGDGNHSLATAKACYEEWKAAHPNSDTASHPLRYALVELQNIHDASQQFEPIHRMVQGVEVEPLLQALQDECGAPEGYPVQWISAGRGGTLLLDPQKGSFAVAIIQSFLDGYLQKHPAKMDYIHGEQALRQLCTAEDTIGFLLEGMDKNTLFSGVDKGGVLPRKTFSMGHAQEKRYYLEARLLKAED